MIGVWALSISREGDYIILKLGKFTSPSDPCGQLGISSDSDNSSCERKTVLAVYNVSFYLTWNAQVAPGEGFSNRCRLFPLV